ncbi:MAG: PD-(D/E)XK nuclease family protein [Bacteroidetes bacterium]|nr:PD-(D/E)XK nuclease family protein [Bacteroidota bacterium]
MQYFLSQVAEYILNNYADKTHEICIVTPNRRSGLFFRNHLASLTRGPIWAPEIISFEDFLSRLTGLNKCDNITTIIEFYKIYKEIHKEKAESIEDFIKWAPTLIKDFNDIDAAVVNTKDFFSYLNDLKNLETWNPDGSGLTDFQKNYLDFFKSMEKYYSKLTEFLIQKKLAYQGLSIRYAHDNIELLSKNMTWGKVIFAGFNAMPKGEDAIIRKLVKTGYADILWDADYFYLNNKNHEAGSFLRRYKENWGLNDFNFIGDYYKSITKKIHIAGIPKNVNQAKLAGNILKQNENNFKDNETALVLANESLLMPVLNSLPEHIKTLNVTMGYPLKRTSIYGFFEAVFKMHINSEKFGLEKDMPRFYHKDIIRVFCHIGMQTLLSNSKEISNQEITNSIIKSNRVLHSIFTVSELKNGANIIESLPSSFFNKWDNISTSIKNLLEICEKIEIGMINNLDSNPINVDVIDEQAIFAIKSIILRLEIFVTQSDFIQNPKTLFKLFQSLVNESKLTFTGEPLQGLQVIGMLETRNLDFKNLIILSVNEDILPAPSKKVSFINFDVKIKFGIHIYADSDALYAYHFYRLLQRAENVWLIYNTQSESTGGSEKSRFITQIEHELKDYNPDTEITHQIISIPISTHYEKKEIVIDKTEDVISKLFDVNSKGFSPSALSLYINCPLQYYLSYLAGVQEADEVEETIEANTLGIVVHEVLKELYIDFKGKTISALDIKAMNKNIEKVTTEKFRRLYSAGNISSGKNLIIRRMAERFTKNFLDEEIKSIEKAGNKPISIIALEEKYHKSLQLKTDSKTYNINLKGTIDRIDQFNGDIRIIDYKTGFVEKTNLSFSEVDEVFKNPKLNKSFQLLLYSYIYNTDNNNSQEFVPGIFSLRKYSSGLQTLSINKSNKVDKGIIDEFEKGLKLLMTEIFNENIPFSQTLEEENCKYCPFKIVCNRL